MADDAQTGQDGPDTAATQQTAGDTATTDMVARSELEKAAKRRDTALERARDAEQRAADATTKLAEAEGRMVSDEDLKRLQEIKAAEAEAAKTKALKEGDAAAIAEQAVAPFKQQVDGLTKKAAQLQEQLTRTLRDEQLLKAATHAKAVNPNQVAKLLRDRVTMETDPTTGNYVPKFTDEAGSPMYAINGEPTTVESFVAAYLAEPSNANLVQSSTPPGSGAKPAGGTTDTHGVPTTIAEYNALTPEQQTAALAKMSREQRIAMVPSGKTLKHDNML